MSYQERADREAARILRARDQIACTWLCDCEIHAELVYLVPDIIPQGGLVVLYGPPNAGKSTMALDIAFAVAHGALWRNRQAHQGLVVYSGGEGRIGVERRLCALRKQYPNLRGGSLCCDWNVTNFRDRDAVQTFVSAIRSAESVSGEKCVLVVIDTLSRHIYGSDNDPEHMASFIAGCDLVRREIGCAQLVVHHSGKDAGRGARGHSSLLCACDTEIEVTDEKPHWMRITKQRDGARLPALAFDLSIVSLGHDVSGREITAATIDHLDLPPPRAQPKGRQQQRVFEELERRKRAGDVAWPRRQVAGIAESLGVSRTQSYMMCAKLIEGGFLKESAGGVTLS
jgi:hypothetical protein